MIVQRPTESASADEQELQAHLAAAEETTADLQDQNTIDLPLATGDETADVTNTAVVEVAVPQVVETTLTVDSNGNPVHDVAPGLPAKDHLSLASMRAWTRT
ncbi:MAG TPA: hypothetical protein VGD45_28345 [Steroidobacter sp.]|uniref:hypothetical protein n=1 Tax=Steroidobacter sp. TaxID=1978227 RepID=UPI002EDAD382